MAGEILVPIEMAFVMIGYSLSFLLFYYAPFFEFFLLSCVLHVYEGSESGVRSASFTAHGKSFIIFWLTVFD